MFIRIFKQYNSKILSIVLFVILFILFGYQAYKIAFIKQWPDFGIYIAASKQFFLGNNPYIPVVHADYIYPLFLSVILFPLTLIPPIAAQFIWYILSVTSLIYAIILMMRILEVTNKTQYFVSTMVVILFISIIQDDLMHSNINSIILFLCTLSLYQIKNNNNIFGLIALSLAVSIKIIPIVLCLWIVAINIFGSKFNKNNLLNPIYLTAFILLFTIVIPYIFQGNQIFDWYNYYYNHFITQQMAQSGTSKYNLTLAGGFYSMLSNNPNSSPPFIIKIISGITLCLFPIILLIKTRNIIYPFILCLIIMLLVDTNAEQHHLLLLLPAFILLINFIINMNNQVKLKKISLSVFLPVIMLMILWGNKIKLIPVEMFGLLFLLLSSSVKLV